MSKLNILTYPDPFLKTKARAVESVGEAEQSLIEDMVETMYGARGIGLAATQVGVDKRIIILDVP
ncbi:MAG: peptide deformylase, partial [Deltaproteobacteria bacterium]|nr:peptide deformylase [Deltaproteobacteria bacterium]